MLQLLYMCACNNFCAKESRVTGTISVSNDNDPSTYNIASDNHEHLTIRESNKKMLPRMIFTRNSNVGKMTKK